jgi:hypothetical protein
VANARTPLVRRKEPDSCELIDEHDRHRDAQSVAGGTPEANVAQHSRDAVQRIAVNRIALLALQIVLVSRMF